MQIIERRIDARVRELVDEVTRSPRSANQRALSAYFSACMNESAAEVAGATPIKEELDRISNVKDSRELAPELARLHAMLYLIDQGSIFPSFADPGSRQTAFGFSAGQDYDDASLEIARIDQGGLTLPDRESYLRQDEAAVTLRKQYVAYIQQQLLRGTGQPVSLRDAQGVLDIETAFAEAWTNSATRVDRRNLNHRLTHAELQSLTPHFSWTAYLAAVGAPETHHFVVANPAFLASMERLLAFQPLADWRHYLQFHLVNATAPMLGSAFAKAEFSFSSGAVLEVSEPPGRVETCLRALDRDLPDAVAELYVTQELREEDRGAVATMAAGIDSAMQQTLRASDWISEETRREALAKATATRTRIGRPDHWKTYPEGSLSNSWVRNAFALSQFEWAHQLSHIGSPVDRDEWWMSPLTTDAYNNVAQNNITITAAMLLPPFYDHQLDDAVNYGAIGSLMGHEYTHGYDTLGRHFNHRGDLVEWWPATDARRFSERAQCISDQYSGFVAVGDAHVNGALTSAENIADAVGVRLALEALHATRPRGRQATNTSGFTIDQRFFIAYAQSWCSIRTDAAMRSMVQHNPHSPPKYRVNGVVSNMPEFSRAFGCHVGEAMVHRPVCRVW